VRALSLLSPIFLPLSSQFFIDPAVALHPNMKLVVVKEVMFIFTLGLINAG
jgi:hypothetical protein